MSERPLIFSGPMVQALLAGIKTMTRRPMKPSRSYIPPTSRFEVGGHFWVKETWIAEARYDALPPREIPQGSAIWYWADGNHYADKVAQGAGKVRPSIFMPRWASRITREIMVVRAERLQEITEKDAIAEGFRASPFPAPFGGIAAVSAKYLFQAYWDSLYKKEGYGLADNPRVWVYEFKEVKDA